MAVEWEDKSDEPRSEEELRKALQHVEAVMAKQIKVHVSLAVVREALMELIKLREAMELLLEYTAYVASSKHAKNESELLDFDFWKKGR